MLNLSDKELDHFAKEAAQEYDPGNVLGERSWEGLEIRLDRDLGKIHLNPLRHIRRFPFYYAPAMLVLWGVSYYLIRRAAGPPGRVAKASAAVVQNSSSSQSPDYKKTTTLDPSAATPTLSADKADGKPVGAGKIAAGGSGAVAAAGGSAPGGSAVGGSAAGGSAAAGSDPGGSAAGAARTNGGAGSTAGAGDVSKTTGVGSATGSVESTTAAGTGSAAGTTTGAAGSMGAAGMEGARGSASAAGSTIHARGRNHRRKNGQGSQNDNALAIMAPANPGRVTNSKDAAMKAATVPGGDTVGMAGRSTGNIRAAARGELGKVALQGLRPTKKTPYISDSALRAFTLKSTAPQLIRRGGLRINRSLEFGILAAPDFASVNSLAGDRPGSTIGVTVDYQFANHWYVGSGLLLDRKIFSAYGHDFHVPEGFYQANGIPDDISLVKGTFEMLEIPLNLRYDFTVSGSTMFFLSGGLSSYLLASQNNNYYYFSLRNPGGGECTPVSSSGSYLFSALNVSAGVETGLSNSLSLLIAPYMKIPVRGVGIGQVQMSSVGINFALRFAPVISRRRN